MTAEVIAADLYRRAVAEQQAVRLIDPADDVAAIRAEVRRLARQDQTRIRTGIVDDSVLAVIRADAELFAETTDIMRQKLRP